MMRQKEHEIREFNRLYKEMDDIFHDIALRIGVSDSAFTIFYIICELGDGCLQKDICYESFANKQTINSSIRKLEQEGYLYLKQGKGRDKHIYLTEMGRQFVQEKIKPVMEIEDQSFLALSPEERSEFLRLYQKYVENFREREKKL
ncbi:MarR family transcriptional regulator [Clostridium sp. AM58-1XD]|uniref:MarR family winged helix-turn-helix transcriptional regulator n=1 Tax=Clostridium sp. AM58-1XD TaxID=2292307 RepID=UPI00325B72AA